MVKSTILNLDQNLIFTDEEYIDPFDETSSLEEMKIGEVVVTDKILEDKAWVVPKTKKLKLNSNRDFVKMNFKKSLPKP